VPPVPGQLDNYEDALRVKDVGLPSGVGNDRAAARVALPSR